MERFFNQGSQNLATLLLNKTFLWNARNYICFFETQYKPLNTYCCHSKKPMEARLIDPLLISCIDSIRCLPLHRMPQPLDSSKLDPTPPLLTQLYADVRWIKNTSLNSFENLNYKSYYVLQIWFGKKTLD